VIHPSRRLLGTDLPGALLLKVARGVKTLDTIRHTAGISSMAMPSAALAEWRVARLLVTLEQLAIVVPVLAAAVIALPRAALLIAIRIGSRALELRTTTSRRIVLATGLVR
jgi:hypothetical protein